MLIADDIGGTRTDLALDKRSRVFCSR